MPFSTSQFTDKMLESAANWQAVNGNFNPPQGYSKVPDLPATQIFSSYSATMGQANLAATFKPVYPWGVWIYANGLDQNTSKVSWFGGNQFKRVCLHDASWLTFINPNGYGTLRGNCVPITPRILLMTVHGTDCVAPGQGTLQWCVPPNIILSRVTAAEQTNPPTFVDTGGVQGGFRLWLLRGDQSDIPEQMICPLLNPADAPTLTGAPVVAYNNYREATCWEIETVESSGAFSLKRSTNTSLSKVWRRFNNTTDPDTSTLDHDLSASAQGDDAGSGTPLFLVFTNSVGQTQFVYFGHVTAGEDTCSGPSYFTHHNDIMSAVTTLNATAGVDNNNPYFRPRYVTNSTWGTLTNGLVAYWKLIESSGSRTNSVGGSYTLIQIGSNTVGNTWGKLYRYAGDFVHAYHVRTAHTSDTNFTGDLTISAWCFVRDGAYPYLGLVTKGAGSGGDQQWSLVWDNYYFKFGINGNSQTIAASPYAAVGQWHHVLAWYKSSNQTTNIRLNNGTTVTTSANAAINTGDTQVGVGGFGSQSSTIDPWWDRIGPVAIWNRVLTGPEQEAVWNGGDGSTYPMVG